MLYNVRVWDEAFYHNIEADSREEAEEIALNWFDERAHKMKTAHCVDILLTDEIHKIITECPSLEEHYSNNNCEKYCPLAKVCQDYWTGS